MRIKRYLAWLLAALLMVSPALAEAAGDDWPEVFAADVDDAVEEQGEFELFA